MRSKRKVAFSTIEGSREMQVGRGSARRNITDKRFPKIFQDFISYTEKKLIDAINLIWHIVLGRCGSCEFEHRQMHDGWG